MLAKPGIVKPEALRKLRMIDNNLWWVRLPYLTVPGDYAYEVAGSYYTPACAATAGKAIFGRTPPRQGSFIIAAYPLAETTLDILWSQPIDLNYIRFKSTDLVIAKRDAANRRVTFLQPHGMPRYNGVANRHIMMQSGVGQLSSLEAGNDCIYVDDFTLEFDEADADFVDALSFVRASWDIHEDCPEYAFGMAFLMACQFHPTDFD